MSNAYVTSIRKSINDDKLKAIALSFPDLNIKWLLYGEGEMLNEESNSDNKNYEYNKNSIDMNIDKFLTIIQSQNEMIRQKDEEIRQLRAELEEARGYSSVRKDRVG